MTAALHHRGPDSNGVWVSPDGALALGHARLAIVDLSEQGRQPMTSRSGRFVTVFNGEIYNHLDPMYKVIGVDGKEYGPASADQVRQWISAGRANAQTRACFGGTTEWKVLASFSEFSFLFMGPPPIPASKFTLASISASPGSKVPNYLAPAILTTLCCCLPLGIPAIVYSAQVSSKLQAGDIAGAAKSSASARIWCWIAFGAGAVIYLGYLLVGAASGSWNLGKF